MYNIIFHFQREIIAKTEVLDEGTLIIRNQLNNGKEIKWQINLQPWICIIRHTHVQIIHYENVQRSFRLQRHRWCKSFVAAVIPSTTMKIYLPQSHSSPTSTILFPQNASAEALRQFRLGPSRTASRTALMLPTEHAENLLLFGRSPEVADANIM